MNTKAHCFDVICSGSVPAESLEIANPAKCTLSVGVMPMVRSDKASSGVIFTLDPESGFREVVVIASSYGLGEFVVQGVVIPDEWTVFKSTLRRNHPAIIGRRLGIIGAAPLATTPETLAQLIQ